MTARWHILGVGAIGSLFASSLHQAGISTILLRRDTSPQNQTQDIKLDWGGSTASNSFPTSKNSDSEPVSHLLITTKAYDVHSALAEVAHRLTAESHVVILVNGMGFMEGIRSDYPLLEFTLGTTTEGVYPIAPGHFCHAGKGLTRLGQTERTKPPGWYSAWSRMDLATVWEPNIEEAMWQKLCVNCAINPLTALHQCKNGELAKRPALARLVEQLCEEIACVSMAAGFKNTSANIHRWVIEIITATANNRSSMLQDLQAGRRTEIDYISGYFIRRATQLRIAVPVTIEMFEGVKMQGKSLH